MLAQRAEEVLEIATEAGREIGEDMAILINRQGGMRMLNAAGWSLSGLLAEFGAAAVYKVERRSSAIRWKPAADRSGVSSSVPWRKRGPRTDQSRCRLRRPAPVGRTGVSRKC